MSFLENIFKHFFYVVMRPGNLFVSKIKAKIISEQYAIKRKEFQTLYHVSWYVWWKLEFWHCCCKWNI